MSIRIQCVLWAMVSLAARRNQVSATDDLDRTELLTNGLKEWVEEGSGLSVEDLLSDEEGGGLLGERLLDDGAFDHNGTCTNSVMTLEHRNYILYTHNKLRSKLAQGRQPNKEGIMGSGRNIYLLKWDCDLERMARKWSQACPSFPASRVKVSSGSQLIKEFDLNYEGVDVTQHIDDSMRSWWLEYKRKGNVDFKNRYSSAQNYYGWATMAKGKTTRIGCSYWICEEKRAIFTCVYNAKAHCEKGKIYEPGPPCSCDDDCTTYPNSRCIPMLGLCQAPDIPRDRKANTMCSAVNTSMTDYFRNTALDLHNFYRSRLARGLEFNGEINTTQHGAKNMIKLEYDCKLEEYAQTWADRCKFEHSNSWERPNQGQNLYMTTIRKWETTSLLHTAIEVWWKELEEHGVPADAFLSEAVWAQKGRLIGHFTQMACGKSQRLGCAVSKCPDMEFVVCHYGPSGNRKGHAIYEIGSHCRVDADCPPGFHCISREGLCSVQRTL